MGNLKRDWTEGRREVWRVKAGVVSTRMVFKAAILGGVTRGGSIHPDPRLGTYSVSHQIPREAAPVLCWALGMLQ